MQDKYPGLEPQPEELPDISDLGLVTAEDGLALASLAARSHFARAEEPLHMLDRVDELSDVRLYSTLVLAALDDDCNPPARWQIFKILRKKGLERWQIEEALTTYVSGAGFRRAAKEAAEWASQIVPPRTPKRERRSRQQAQAAWAEKLAAMPPVEALTPRESHPAHPVNTVSIGAEVLSIIGTRLDPDTIVSLCERLGLEVPAELTDPARAFVEETVEQSLNPAALAEQLIDTRHYSYVAGSLCENYLGENPQLVLAGPDEIMYEGARYRLDANELIFINLLLLYRGQELSDTELGCVMDIEILGRTANGLKKVFNHEGTGLFERYRAVLDKKHRLNPTIEITDIRSDEQYLTDPQPLLI